MHNKNFHYQVGDIEGKLASLYKLGYKKAWKRMLNDNEGKDVFFVLKYIVISLSNPCNLK